MLFSIAFKYLHSCILIPHVIIFKADHIIKTSITIYTQIITESKFVTYLQLCMSILGMK